MTRALAPVLIVLSLALGACGSDTVDDVKGQLEKVATDVRDWADAHADWDKALETAKDSEVAKIASEQVASMRKAAEDIADDVRSVDDEDIKKALEPMSGAVDDLQKAADDVVAALKSKSQDAYTQALVAYERARAEAIKAQQEASKLIDEKLNEK